MGQEGGRWGWQGAEDWYLESYCSEHPLCKTSCCWAPRALISCLQTPCEGKSPVVPILQMETLRLGGVRHLWVKVLGGQ